MIKELEKHFRSGKRLVTAQWVFILHARLLSCVLLIIILGMNMNGCIMAKPREVITLGNAERIRLLAQKDELALEHALPIFTCISVAGVWDIAFSPDSRILAAGVTNFYYILGGIGNKRSIKFYDADTLRLIKKVDTSSNSEIGFNANGTVVGSRIGAQIDLWNMRSFEKICTLNMDTKWHGIGPLFLPKGDILAYAADDGAWSSTEAVVELWDSQDKQKLFEIKLERLYPASSVCLAVSPDGKILAIGYSVPGGEVGKGEVLLWDMKTRKEIAIWREDVGGVYGLEFSPNGKILAMADYRGPTGTKWAKEKTVDRISLWSVEEGKLIGSLSSYQTLVGSLSFSPDGNILATCRHHEKMIRLWDVQARKEIARIDKKREFSKVIFRPDGKAIAATDGTRLYLYAIP